MKFFAFKKLLKKNIKAFSLIELSIVVVIISVLLSGALSVAINTTNSSKIINTKNNIDEIYKALKVYLAKNKKLPCPAPITEIKSTNNGYGASSGTDGNCSEVGVFTTTTAGNNYVYGMVPVQNLNLSADIAQDAYGSKLAYIVDKRYTSTATFGAANTSLFKVSEVVGTSASEFIQTDTASAIFVIISYGANKLGAFGVNSSTQNTLASGYELGNNITNIVANDADFIGEFYSKVEDSDTFDDIVFYKTRNQITVEADALDTIPCIGDTVNSTDQYNNLAWPTSNYGQVVPSSIGCPTGYQQTVMYPTRKCGPLGKWQEGYIDPCTYTATPLPSTLSCTGGTVPAGTSDGLGNTYHKFTSGTSNLVCTGSGTITYLVVGGGGGGGGTVSDGGGGGGGGGGVSTGTYPPTPGEVGTISVTVGAAGTAGGVGGNGGNGGTSSLGSVKSSTGGTGGHYGGNNDGTGGNSGTGNFAARTGGGSGICPNGIHGGGGGGSSMENNGSKGEDTGVNPSHGGGNGATGTPSSITGSSVVYGSGGGGSGGGGGSEGYKGLGGSGAGNGGGGSEGGPSDPTRTPPVAGTANRGGGGGGGGVGGSGSGAGAAGGKGVVIISYPTP